MYEELIDELRLESTNMHYDKPDCELFAKAADAIEELQKKVAFEEALAECWEGHAEGCRARFQKLLDAYPKWISVEERLPENGRVLCVRKSEAFPGQRYVYILTADHGEFRDGAIFTADGNVTHWMPLPEPPKEEPNGTE